MPYTETWKIACMVVCTIKKSQCHYIECFSDRWTENQLPGVEILKEQVKLSKRKLALRCATDAKTKISLFNSIVTALLFTF